MNETACLVLLREFQVQTYLIQELRLHLSLAATVIRPGSQFICDSVYMDEALLG